MVVCQGWKDTSFSLIRRDVIQESSMLPGEEVNLLALDQFKMTVSLACIVLSMFKNSYHLTEKL